MSDLARFAVFMAFASGVFLAVLAFITRKRQCKPSPVLFCVITAVVVVGRYAIRSLWPHLLPSTLVDLLRPTRIDDNLIAPNSFAHAASGNIALYSTGFSDGSGDSYVFLFDRRMARLHAVPYLHSFLGGAIAPALSL